MTNEKLDERRSDRDLLVRIDERVRSLDSRMEKIEENNVLAIAYKEKVITLQRMVYGQWVFIGAIVLYLIKDNV